LYRVGDVNQLAAAIQSLGAKPELAEKMGIAGWEKVGHHHTPDGHYQKLLSLYEGLVATKAARKQPSVAIPGRTRWRLSRRIPAAHNENPLAAEHGRRLRVAFIDFTPALAEHNGMRLVRLPTIRSKHLETVIHTLLSTAHALTQRYDVVHYHALGSALFSFLPRLFGQKTAVTVQGLDWQRKKWGRVASAVLRLGERASVRLPNGTGPKPSMCPTAECCGSAVNRERFWSGVSIRGDTFYSSVDSLRRKDVIYWSRRLNRLIRTSSW